MPKTIHTKEYRNIVDKLKQARIESGLTQQEVAKKINMPQSYISKVEAGEQRLDVVELKELSKVYKKPISFFI
ncbi:hypothetical protein A2456_02485 [Candidatus Nomurabacteria bacterium RIFOXYC2_FULL_36_19]|uniref:HTH cro/C1-type domain-containing protein n=1 Tax=Candidatus Nomurabacteria bacterium RIFOXYC2_FULL_36_19 TaxID=1801806 RepID=A0A1F6YVY2_9BACT|nr:MAG: hypothetical protein A2223_02325 [Candidatus Falkowbacteria bacterium RIFOXYA2_FULL_35_8]OGJ10571.1 MAG: hypothetical protein A2456_02485 [Candidatus Nomurabacteria bacterium RIFOXYC2_FULL_36_19]